METTTARVDLQRLQILSDRIAHTLEALNQVRMSAHNIGVQTPWGARPAVNPYATSFLPQTTVSPFGFSNYGYGQTLGGFYGQPMMNNFSQPMVSPFGYNQAFGINNVAQTWGQPIAQTWGQPVGQTFGQPTAHMGLGSSVYSNGFAPQYATAPAL